MSLTRVDLPEPETPVTTVMTPSGEFDGEVFEVVAARDFEVIHLPVRGRGTRRWRVEISPER